MQSEDRQIIDSFLFDSEFDILEHRLAETFDLVDAYIIVEAGETFRGEPKPMLFSAQKDRFSRYASKIKHVGIPRLGDERTDPWQRERNQRNAVLYGLKGVGPEAILLILDVDEIPSRSLLVRLRSEGLDVPRRLLMTRHYEAVDLLGPKSPCCPLPSDPFPFATGRKVAPAWDKLGVEWFSRSGVAAPLRTIAGESSAARQAPFDVRRSAPLVGGLPDAGRHLTFVDPSSHPARKLGRVAHAELSGGRAQSEVHLSRCARYAIHHRGWWYAERPEGRLPDDLVRLIVRCPELRSGMPLPPRLARHVVRTWAWLRSWPKLPDGLVKTIDCRFAAWSFMLAPLLLILDAGRFVAARCMSAPLQNSGNGSHHIDN